MSESSKKDSKSLNALSGELIESDNHEEVGVINGDTKFEYLEECPIEDNKVVVHTEEGNHASVDYYEAWYECCSRSYM